MNKGELIDAFAQESGQTKAEASRSVEALLSVVTNELTKGGVIALAGFGTFSTSSRPARKGRNPQTGASIDIAASTDVKFKTGSKLKAAVNGVAE